MAQPCFSMPGAFGSSVALPLTSGSAQLQQRRPSLGAPQRGFQNIGPKVGSVSLVAQRWGHDLLPVRQLMQGASRLGRSSGEPSEELEAPTTPLLAMSMNLLKNIIGATVLSLASGVAAFSDRRAALVPATFLVLLVGLMTGYTFSLIVRSCELLGVRTFREAWEASVGKKSGWLISVASLFMAGSGCLQYIMVLGEAGSSLASAAGLPPFLASRQTALLVIISLVILPLSFFERCDQLKFTSAVGVTGVFYYIVAILIRYLQGAYAPGGQFFQAITPELRPSFGLNPVSWTGSLVMVSMLTSAYVCHYNAPKFFRELENRSIPRFNWVVLFGFGISAAVYVVGMGASFLTFGGHSTGFIFANYAAKDPLFVVARAIVSVVMLCTYPLLFIGTRDGVMEMFAAQAAKEEGALRQQRRVVTVGLVALLTVLALTIKDIGVIVAVPGALTGSALVYIFPALMFLGATKRGLSEGKVSFRVRLERTLCRAFLGVGVVLASLGTLTSLGVI